MNKSLKALESLISTHINIQNGTNMIFNTSKILGELNLIKQDLERLEELEKENQELKELQELNKQGLWNLKQENKVLKQSVKDTYDTSQEIIADLKKELDTFKLAFYTLWKCCNSNNIPTDVEETDNYLEFRCGYESLCIPVTEQEIESIKKATGLLDINVKEVLENE